MKNEKIEAFAGDVTSLVDLNLIETSENEENVIVANNSESINEVISEVEENEILNNVNEEISTEAEDPIAEVAVIDTELVQSVEISVDQSNTKTVRYRELAENDPPTEYVNVVEATATAYCLCKKCCGKTPDNPYYGYTHSGIKIEPGTGMKVIAVDPSVIPLNSKVYVEGLNGAWDYGHAIAADTGSAIKELKIDLYMDTHEEALEWGRRKVKVYVLGE